jgi:quercetin dioxygenase-like cupin family protein
MIDRNRFAGELTHRIESAGGVAIEGRAEVAVMLGNNLMAVKLVIEPGYFHPWHNHPSNESMGVVVEGFLEMKVGDEVRQYRPGDVWHHPVGQHHWTRAIERTLAVEFHAPLRRDLVGLPHFQPLADHPGAPNQSGGNR